MNHCPLLIFSFSTVVFRFSDWYFQVVATNYGPLPFFKCLLGVWLSFLAYGLLFWGLCTVDFGFSIVVFGLWAIYVLCMGYVFGFLAVVLAFWLLVLAYGLLFLAYGPLVY